MPYDAKVDSLAPRFVKKTPTHQDGNDKSSSTGKTLLLNILHSKVHYVSVNWDVGRNDVHGCLTGLSPYSIQVL